jgi:hypothetical protein
VMPNHFHIALWPKADGEPVDALALDHPCAPL